MSSQLDVLAIAYALLEDMFYSRRQARERGARTLVVEKHGVSGEAFSVKGNGVVDEAVVVSSGKEYRILFETGDGVVVNGDWGKLSLISPYTSFVDAFEEYGSYVTRIANVFFRGYARLVVVEGVVDKVVAKITMLENTISSNQ